MKRKLKARIYTEPKVKKPGVSAAGKVVERKKGFKAGKVR